MVKEDEDLSAKLQVLIDNAFMPKAVAQTVRSITMQTKLKTSSSFHLQLSFSGTSTPNTTDMRLPGTFNIVNNDLPSPEFLEKLKAIKEKRKAVKADAVAIDAKNDASNSMPTKHKADNGGNDNTSRKLNVQDEKSFTSEEDNALIEHKLRNSSWKLIATELGKDVGQVKKRFSEIKPVDFDKRLQEAQAAKKAEKRQSGGGGNVPRNKERSSEGQAQNQSVKENNSSIAKQGEKHKSKGASGAQKEGSDEGEENIEWWQKPDGNWSKEELEALLDISNEELKNAFAQMAIRLAKEHGKEVHPASIAEKILDAKPKWA